MRILILVLLAASHAAAEEASFDAEVARLMRKHVIPGASLAVVKDGKLVRARGYGVVEVGKEQAVDEKTLFQAASISKPVAALATLRLVENGKLLLDEDVNQKLTSWKLPENVLTKQRKVTLRMILSHSGGLTVHGFPGYAKGDKVPTLLQLLDGRPPANSSAIRVDIAPGQKESRYSGGGYCVMQQLLIDVTGKPFPGLLQEQVLKPLGMERSTYEQPLPAKRRAEAAAGHRAWWGVPGKHHTYPEMAAAGLWTTPSDLARVIIGLQEALRGKEGAILSQKMAEQMLTVQAGGFGLGILVQGDRFQHGGANAGYRCLLLGTRDGKGMVVMTNSDRGGRMFGPLLDLVGKEYGWQ